MNPIVEREINMATAAIRKEKNPNEVESRGAGRDYGFTMEEQGDLVELALKVPTTPKGA